MKWLLLAILVAVVTVGGFCYAKTPTIVETPTTIEAGVYNLFRGLVYIKHHSVGAENEGPSYRLQTINGDFVLDYKQRTPQAKDFRLEFFGRRMVEIIGTVDKKQIKVYSIKAYPSQTIPKF